MKLAVLGDPHFGGGYALGKIDPYRQLNTRLLDHANTFDHVIDYLADEEICHLIVTGDVFEHRRPEASQMSVFSERLVRLADLGIRTHFVIGNHDLVRAHKTTTIDLLRNLRIPMVNVYSEIESFHCEDPQGGAGVNLILFPFRTRQMLQCATNEEAVRYLSDRLQHELRSLAKPGPSLLVGHFALQGAKSHDMSMEEHAVFEIVLPLSMFKGVDAVVMGHIHQFQVLSSDPLIAHIGSMERTDFGEAKHEKYLMVAETSGKRLVTQFVPLSVRGLHDLSIDMTADAPGTGTMDRVKKWLRDFAGNDGRMVGSIVRLEILVGESVAHELDAGELSRLLTSELLAETCVGVHIAAVSKRQLRDSSITERTIPVDSFIKYIEMVDDVGMRELMRTYGSKIIEEMKN